MTLIDIQFWLLAALLGGCIWAIEAGLSSRHRKVLLSSMASTLLSILIFMFYVEDKTELVPFEAQKFAKKQGGPAAEKEAEEDGGGGNREGGGGGDGSGSRDGNNGERDGANSGGRSGGRERAAGQGDQNSAAGDSSKAEDIEIEYSRTPFKDCPVCPDMVIVPKGVASVGAGADDPARQPNERPVASVPMPKPLAVGRLEIMRNEFAAFAKDTGFVSDTPCATGAKRRGTFNWQRPGFEQDERHPVVCLSWPEVRLYLAWLSEKAGRTYRLPTEVEWEHAARAGTDTPYSMGSTITRFSSNMGRSRDGTTVGGLFGQNRWGLSDFAGNVWEMTAQCAYDLNVTKGAADAPAECRRVIKGGSWAAGPVQARHAARAFIGDATGTNDIGFRVVREVDERDDHRILTADQKKRLAEDARNEAEIAKQAKLAAEDAARKRIEEAEKAEAEKAAKEAQKK
jgi:formylglycine-generating enzyme required for sulfatase activity